MFINQVLKLNIIMPGPYLSNVLYTQSFDPRNDIIVSFLYTGGKDITHTASNYNGLGIFLVDGNVATLSGGLSGAQDTAYEDLNPGLGIITDTTTSAVSAISGLLMACALDWSGAFGKKDSLAQFTTGTETIQPGNIAVRVLDSDTSTFTFKGSKKPSNPFFVDDGFSLFRIGFKRYLQDIVIYKRDGSKYNADIEFKTDIPFDTIPSSVRIGFSYSGLLPLSLKNIAINASVIDV
jgi:hypothetical protein